MPKLAKDRRPAYRLHKARGLAVVTLSDKGHYYLGPHESKVSREEYGRLIARWLANGRRLPNTAEPVDLTVNELVAAYWRFAQGYYRENGHPTTEIAKIRAAMRSLSKLYGQAPVAAFGPLRLKDVRQELISTGQCRRSVNQQVGRIKRMFKWGVENEHVPPSVFHGLQAVAGLEWGRSDAGETDPVRPVPEAQIAVALPHMSRQIRAMVQLQLVTGMRPDEVRLIRGYELDLRGKIWSYSPASHKTQHHGIEHTVYLGPQAQEVVKPFLAPDRPKGSPPKKLLT